MKRLLSILLFCAMVLTMLPAPAFAEDVCTCTNPCTAEYMNSACPVCGAEGAAPESCAPAANLSDETPDPDPVTQFTVTWNGNGGTVDTTGATTSAAAGTVITPPTNNPTRAQDENYAYEFDGWYTEAEGGTKLSDTDTVNGNVSYFAHWRSLPVPTWNTGWNSLINFRFYCKTEEKYLPDINLASISETGYTCSTAYRSGNCWRFEIDLTNPADHLPAGHYISHKFGPAILDIYPSGVPGAANGLYNVRCTHSVTWDGNGGTVDTSGATGSAAYGTAINPPANAPTRTADSKNVYFFDGWYTEAEGGEKVTDFGTVQGDVTYYAHWIPAPVFDPDGLDIEVSCDYYESHSIVVHLAGLNPSEYTVSGPVLSADGKWWSYDVTLNDPAAYFREPHLLGDTGQITPATKKYAVSDGEINCLEGKSCVTCKPNTIQYLPDDYSTGSIPADTKEIGTSIRLSYETFTREGYRQTGWATEKDGPQIYIPGELYAKNEDLTLYPCWERIYTTDIPAVIEVRQGGELAPGKTDFELLIRSLNGHVLASGVFFDNLFPATDGVGTYHSPIRASGSENDLAFLSDGVLVWQRKSADTRWSCSDAIYYVCLFPTATPYAAAEPTAEPAPDYQYEIHPVQVVDGQYIPLDETVSAMTFVNTYTENAPRFTVTVENDGHGTGAADPAEAPAGTQITLTAAPNKGYVFKEWKVVSGDVTVEKNGFTMPSGNVTVKAVFEKAGKLDNVPKTGDTDISPLPFFFAAAIAAVLLFPKKKQD